MPQQTFAFSASRVTEEEGMMTSADVMALENAHLAMRNVRPILYMYTIRAGVYPSTCPAIYTCMEHCRPPFVSRTACGTGVRQGVPALPETWRRTYTVPPPAQY